MPRERTEAMRRLLSTTTGALLAATAVGEKQLPNGVRQQLVAAAMAHPDSQVRDLFERFVPDEQRVKRLGSVIKPEQILALKGSAARGQELFFKSAGLQCANCHRIGGTGSSLGPDLSRSPRNMARRRFWRAFSIRARASIRNT